MSQAQSKCPSPIVIREEGQGERPVLLWPKDDDRFIRTARQVVEACELNIGFEVWLDELEALAAHVAAWASSRSAQILECYCVLRGTKTVFFFVPASPSYDFDLGEAMGGLSEDAAGKFNVGAIEFRQVPSTEKFRFFSPDTARRVYGEAAGPHSAVATQS